MTTYWDDCLKSYDFAAARTAETELWTIGETTGSLYNYGNSCMIEAASKYWDSMKNAVSGDKPAETTPAETTTATADTSAT